MATPHIDVFLPDDGVGAVVSAFPSEAVVHLSSGTDPGRAAAWIAGLTKTPAQIFLRLTADGIGDANSAVAEIARVAREAGIGFGVDIVIPDDADVVAARLHDQGGLAGICHATEVVRAKGLAPRWLIPLIPALVYRLETLFSLARASGAEPLLVPAPVLGRDAHELSVADRLFAWDFVTYRILGNEIGTLTKERIGAYRAMQATLGEGQSGAFGAEDWGTTGKDGIAFAPRAGAGIGAALLAAERSTKTGPGRVQRIGTAIADVADVLTLGVSGHLRSRIPGRPVGKGRDPKIETALLIGAYGGEHIGDAAILGGVLLRIHARHGTRRAILMTQRPYHTRHLIPMLDVPVEVEVREYTAANIRRGLSEASGVVFAGGPLTDLPKQLVRHLETVSRARRLGLPFVMEGIGPGSFARRPSRVTARRLLELADRITLRTSDNATSPIMQGLRAEVGRDPAFDYLATRGEDLSRLPTHEPIEVERLLADAEDRPVIGLNVRPIGHLFTVAPDGADPASFTREIEDRFEREFAAGLAQFAAAAPKPPIFVFFPMNAIQFGMSDLTSAWRIIQHLPKGTDFRLWEADASLDGVVDLLRRVDCVVSMRFHGAIFALSQSRPVIGIDYRIGKRDKVAAVMADAGFPDDVQRIDELRADWLSLKLQQKV